MGGDKTAFLGTLFKSWWVRGAAAFAVLFTLINGYAGVQDQFEALPKLQDIIPVPYLGFLPWWGWLLVWLYVFLAVFVYALFEYVRLKLSPKFVPASASDANAKHASVSTLARPSARMQLGSWAHVDEFKVSEAACLWAGFLPGASYIFDKTNHPAIVGAERLIISELASVIDMNGAPWGTDDLCKGIVTRPVLLELAERKGFKPPFLYPDN